VPTPRSLFPIDHDWNEAEVFVKATGTGADFKWVPFGDGIGFQSIKNCAPPKSAGKCNGSRDSRDTVSGSRLACKNQAESQSLKHHAGAREIFSRRRGS
jgi:hypothetical protein